MATPVNSEVGLPVQKFLLDCSNAISCLRCEHCRNFETFKLADLRHHFKAKHAHLEARHTNDCCSFEPVLVNDRMFFECQSCPYLAKRKSDLKRHILRKHTDRTAIQWFECDQCPYKTHVEQNLIKHDRSVHGNKPKYKCDRCQFETEFELTIERHISQKHTDIVYPYLKDHDYCSLEPVPKCKMKRFKCQNCRYSADQKVHLKLHFYRIHTVATEMQWFECDNCPYKSQKKSSVTHHNNMKHCRYRSKYRCDEGRYEAKYTYTTWDDVQWFECEHCPYKSSRQEDLNRHVNNVHGEKENLNRDKI